MKKYKVSYSGFAYVEATSESFAELAYDEGDTIFEESEITSIEEVDEFTVRL